MEVIEVSDGAQDSAVVTEKRKRVEADMDYVIDDDILAWLSGEDDYSSETMSDQLMELLDATVTEESSPSKVRFIENPYKPPGTFQTTPSSYVTINGNEESCGSSFSDRDSSVMVSVYTSGGFIGSQMTGFGSLEEVVGLDLESSMKRWLEDGLEAEMEGAWGSSDEGLMIDCDGDGDGDGDSLAKFWTEIFSEKEVA
ncbi:hypothetical protein CsatB_010430 [Cannabis sativa]